MAPASPERGGGVFVNNEADGLFLQTCFDPPPTIADPGERCDELLLRASADPKAVNEAGEGALHLLVKGITCCDTCTKNLWRRELARALVSMDRVDPTRRDRSGATARDLAKGKGFEVFTRELFLLERRFSKGKVGPHTMRFRLGQRVEAHFHDSYQPGRVVKLWDERNAYRIRLDQGTDVWAPADHDSCVRALPECKLVKKNKIDDGRVNAAATAAKVLAGWKTKTQEGDGAGGAGGADGADGADGAEDLDERQEEEGDEGELLLEEGEGDFEPSDKATDDLVEAFASQWGSVSTTGSAQRLKLDPNIFSMIKTSASSELACRNGKCDGLRGTPKKRSKKKKKDRRR